MNFCTAFFVQSSLIKFLGIWDPLIFLKNGCFNSLQVKTIVHLYKTLTGNYKLVNNCKFVNNCIVDYTKVNTFGKKARL